MKYLFVHQNFPGQFLHIVRHLVAARKHEIVFLTEPNANAIPGVRKVPYRTRRLAPEDAHPGARDLDLALHRADAVARTAQGIRKLGYEPDIVIGHHGWGELLNIRDVWPDVPLLGYMEYFYRTEGQDVGFDPEFALPAADHPRVRAKNAVNLLALQLGGHGQTPTAWQLGTYPDWAQERIALLPEGVDLSACKPSAAARREPLEVGGMVIAPHEKLVTYVARGLEPYRGYHVIMRALPYLLRARKDVRVVLVGGDDVSYGAPPRAGTWRQVMQDELGGAIDPARVAQPGKVPYETHLKLLRRSDAHVYLTYPFVVSWSLREALAAGCAVVAGDVAPVREFIADNENGLLASFFDPRGLADTILRVLEDKALAGRLRGNARTYAERNLDVRAYVKAYAGLIRKVIAAG
ncbi:MAG: glycosyltransferase [Proteobacteria bacterium]|nr:glycosyltransferase [Pseudomonadota bacterium]